MIPTLCLPLALLSSQAPCAQLTASIALIGVGDGDPDRQSLGAARWLGSTDVMLHEAAAAATVRALGRRDAERIEIEAGVGSVSEAVLRAERGQRVCLVRAGDPFGDAHADEVELLAATALHWIVFRPAPGG